MHTLTPAHFFSFSVAFQDKFKLSGKLQEYYKECLCAPPSNSTGVCPVCSRRSLPPLRHAHAMALGLLTLQACSLRRGYSHV